VPRRQLARERAVAWIVQKAGRGYLARKKIKRERDHQKMELTFDYFAEIKARMELHSVQFLEYHLKKFLVKRRLKKQKQAEAKAAAAKKNKWGKTGKTGKAPAKAPAKPPAGGAAKPTGAPGKPEL